MSVASWRFNELVDDLEVEAALEDVAAWGYPRAVDPKERDGYWFRLGRGVIWWYQVPQHVRNATGFLLDCFAIEADEMVFAEMHLAVAPRFRGHWPVRTWWTLATAIPESLGVDIVLIATLPEDCKTPEYLSRLGVQQSPKGVWFKRLGERE